jgi:hypothetical protein
VACRLTPMRPPVVKGRTLPSGALFLSGRSKDHGSIEMLTSDLVSMRRRDRLHQTPIQAQPPLSGGVDSQGSAA